MPQKDKIIRGKAYVLGDNVDTDQIIPAKYLNLVPTIPEEYRGLGAHALEGLPDSFPRFVREGQTASEYAVIVAGRNFGCGSSREHAPVALGAAGVRAVLAESYARIFFRNAVATGEVYPLETLERLCDFFTTGDEVEISLESLTVRHLSSGYNFELKPLGAVGPVIEAGGLFRYARATGMIAAPPSETGAAPAASPASAAPSEPDAPAPAPQDPPAETRRTTRLIAVANQKGGVGKTTTVVNLSAYLADKGQKVLVVDLDPQANASSGLGVAIRDGGSLYRVLLGEGSAGDRIQSTAYPGLDIIPSELDLAGSEVDIVQMDQYLRRLAFAVEPVAGSGRYDFIFVDCPPSLGILTMNALSAADAMIVPIQCEYYALEGLSVITRLVERLRASHTNPRIEIEGILLTMYDARTKLSSDVVEEVRRHFGDKVYETVIPRNVRLSEAPSFGKPVMHFARFSSGAMAYDNFAKEFLRRARRS
jgi:chromosome partitioning protein